MINCSGRWGRWGAGVRDGDGEEKPRSADEKVWGCHQLCPHPC